MTRISIGVFVLVLAVFAESKQNVFTPCSISSPDFNKCVMKVAREVLPKLATGIPELNLKSISPHKVDDIQDVRPQIKMEFVNNVVHGADTTEIKDIQIDPKNNKIKLAYTATGFMESDYKIDGNILILPITGKGRSKMGIKNALYTLDMDYKVVKGKDGKDHWKIVKHQASVTPERVTFRYENLFNGNKQLADYMHQFANENWKEIFAELGAPAVKRLTEGDVKIINKFFAAVPLEDLVAP